MTEGSAVPLARPLIVGVVAGQNRSLDEISRQEEITEWFARFDAAPPFEPGIPDNTYGWIQQKIKEWK
ncbi:hypothetical protein [Scytonema sp. NUACC26]|uniref:hypothetical protein n=1 Tax=Scytonema sp. NUACC26 TaxID=3140176 RepID=UPI0034DC4BDB